MRYSLFIMLSLFILLTVSSRAQIPTLQPESVAFDTLNNHYLVSSIASGSIIQIDENDVRSVFKAGFGSCLGNQIAGNTLYFSTPSRVVGLDLNDASEVWSFTFAGLANADGLAADTSGNLYIVGTTAKRIYRVRISDQNYSTFVTSFLTSGPQDITFDPWNNRLLLASYTANAPILGINLEDSSVNVLAVSTVGFFDGITMDQDRNTYLSGSVAGGVYRYDSTFSNPAELIVGGLEEPAGLDFNQRDGILAVPFFSSDTVVFVDLSQPDLIVDGYSLDDTGGDSDGHSDPGESVLLSPRLKNRRKPVAGFTAEISTTDPNLTLPGSSISYPAFGGWGDTASSTAPVTIEVGSTCPDPHVALLEIAITAGEYSRTDSIYLFIGDTPGFTDDVESGQGAWRHMSLTNNVYLDEWHLESSRSHDGSTSWKSGGSGVGDYSGNSDGALISPPFLLPNDGFLTFWHWLTTEATDGSLAYDGALLMISVNGGPWETIWPTPTYFYFTTNESPSLARRTTTGFLRSTI